MLTYCPLGDAAVILNVYFPNLKRNVFRDDILIITNSHRG